VGLRRKKRESNPMPSGCITTFTKSSNYGLSANIHLQRYHCGKFFLIYIEDYLGVTCAVHDPEEKLRKSEPGIQSQRANSGKRARKKVKEGFENRSQLSQRPEQSELASIPLSIYLSGE
jgi:hypothetical protein